MSISLQAVVALDASQFTSGLGAISAATKNAAGAMMMAFEGLGGEILALGHAFGKVGVAVGILKEATTEGAAFEQAMANVRSVTGLAGDEIEHLGKQTVSFAANTRYSSLQAAEALYALGSAGISSGKDLMDVLRPALKLAGATMSDTGTASEAVTSTIQNLRLSFSDAARVANQFAGVIAASPANMERLSEALKFAAPAAGALNMKLETMVKELGALHLAGLKGEMAGTAFRMALYDLTEAAKKGGTTVSNALRGWKAEQEGLTGAIRRFEAAGVSSTKVILEFGARSGAGLAALLNIGSDAVDQMGDKISGLADVEKMYSIQMDTLSARFVVLQHHMEAIGHVIFEKIEPALTSMVKSLTEVVDWVGRLTVAMAHADWATAWKQLRTTAIEAFDAVVSHSQTFAARVGAAIRGTDWAGAWDTFKAGFVGVVNFVYDLRTQITTALTAALSKINADDVKKAFDEIGAVITSILPSIEASFASLWEFVKEGARVAAEFAGEAWRRFADVIGTIDVGALFDRISSETLATIELVKTLFMDGIDTIKAKMLELADQIPGPIRDGFTSLMDGMKSFAEAAGAALSSVVTFVTTLGQSFLTAGQNSAILEKVPGWIGSIADIAGHLASLLSGLAKIIGRVVEALTDIAGSEPFVWALEMAFTALGTALDVMLGIVHGVMAAFDGIANMLSEIPSPILHVVAAIAGGAGMTMALMALKTGITAVILETRTWIAVKLFLLRMNLPKMIASMTGALTTLSPQMAAVGKVAGVMGAAMAGWELGKLIRQIPGVAEWCDKLAVKIWKLTGAMVEEDEALKQQVAALRAKREAEEKNWQVTQSSVVATETATAVAQEATQTITELTKAIQNEVSAIGDVPAAAEPAAAAIHSVHTATAKTAAAAAHMTSAVEKATEAAKKAVTPFQGMGNAIKDLTFSFKVELPHITEYQVTQWGGMYQVFRRLKDLNFAFKVELPHITKYQVDQWWGMLGVFRRLKDLNFAFKVEIPHLTQNQVALWGEFMKIITGGNGVQLNAPKVPDINGNLGRIANALDQLVAMKGVIWA